MSSTPFQIVNRNARHRIVLVCEHASAVMPDEYQQLGLAASTAQSHIAWDPGASTTAHKLSAHLDAVLFEGTLSRLLYDCNRPPDALDAIPEKSEIYDIPGNRALSSEARQHRIRTIYRPFEKALSDLLDDRDQATVLVTMHSFTPVYHGQPRDVEIGFLHDTDSRLADALLNVASGYRIQRNAPYGPDDGVTHTLLRHGIANRLLNVMIEIRNDLLDSEDACETMAQQLASWLTQALQQCDDTSKAEAKQ